MNRVVVIDVLRGFAALAVTWFHLTNIYEWSWLRHSGNYGWLGVEVFFVLSGFVIPYSIAHTYRGYTHADFPSFFVRRVVRLEPPYILSILFVSPFQLDHGLVGLPLGLVVRHGSAGLLAGSKAERQHGSNGQARHQSSGPVHPVRRRNPRPAGAFR